MSFIYVTLFCWIDTQPLAKLKCLKIYVLYARCFLYVNCEFCNLVCMFSYVQMRINSYFYWLVCKHLFKKFRTMDQPLKIVNLEFNLQSGTVLISRYKFITFCKL